MNFRPGLFVILAGAALVFASCKPKDTSVLDDNPFKTPAPHIDSYVVAPDSIDAGTLPPAPELPTDSVTVELTIFVTLAPDTPPATISSASAAVIDAAGNTLARTALHNDGTAPDVIANDSIFSAAISFRIQRRQVGLYRVSAALLTAGNDSNGAEIGFRVANSSNHVPAVENLSAPDTVSAPADTAIKTYVMSVHVSDGDGLSDIFSVSADMYNAQNQYVKTFILKDDGKVTADGDSVAGDAIYSVLLPVDSSFKSSAPYTFNVTATDNSGAVSNTLTKVIYAK